jgi:RNA recognition motif-containing protein
MTDPNTGMPRGYGFVRFHDQSEQQRALIEMQGVYCGSRPMRVSMATPKNSNRNHTAILQQQQQIMIQQHQTTPPAVMQQQFQDPNNTTVFVGGLSSPVNEDELRLVFSPFGEITYVKIPAGKGCGFVQYVHRASAEIAIQQMNGFQINGSRIRLSWGRSQSDKTISQLHPQQPPPQAPQQRSQLPQPLPSASFVQQQQQPQPLMPAVFRLVD